MGARRTPPARLPLPLTEGHRDSMNSARPARPRHARRPRRRRARLGRSPTSSVRPERRRRDRLRGGPRRPRTEHEHELVCRSLQSTAGLATGVLVYGVAIGGIVALAYCCRARPRSAAFSARATARRCSRSRALLAVYVVPFLKYPANPPAVGDPDTIAKRTAPVLPDDGARRAPRGRRRDRGQAARTAAGRLVRDGRRRRRRSPS